MNWHTRYLQQAIWTRDLRKYIWDKAELAHANRILEVGCGSGAILSDLPKSSAVRYGLDLDATSLSECRIHASSALLTRADAHHLPYSDKAFDIAYCHYLLLWVKDPLQTLCEMARVSHYIVALAEPDYSQRIDEPAELKLIGEMQTKSLRKQGANPFLGGTLAEIFYQAGIKIIEAGEIRGQDVMRAASDWEYEWAVIQTDLQKILRDEEIQKMKILNETAYKNGQRVLHIPTFFAWGFRP